MSNTNRLGDYSLIGNCRTAALVSKNGSIDWCCFPEFHSPAIFSALLDEGRGGFFSVAPMESFRSFQNYMEGTVVVETIFETDGGRARLNDAFVVMTEEQKKLSLFPDHEILRIVQCTSGTIHLKMAFEPRIYYGRNPAKLINNKKLGVKFTWKENSFTLLSTLDPEQINVVNNRANASFTLEKGESVIFSLSCSTQSPAIVPELKLTAYDRFMQTVDYWTNWIGQCSYQGVYKHEVRRSALTLKLLAHAPSGAIIAAPTTSLPEAPGSERNWDYRYCWLRDASFTVRVLIKLGFVEEAHAYMNWILHSTKLTQPELQVLYSVYGETKLKEKEIGWLGGFKHSKPVRIGNGAHDQFQLDVYGEVLDAFYSYSKLIPEFDNESRKFMLGLGEIICKKWNEKDDGIWEVRSSSAHHTHSKVMAWVGLDRLVRLCGKYKWMKVPVERFEKVKKEIEDQVENRGFDKELNSYTLVFDEGTPDASSLVFSLVGYCPVNSEKMVATVACIMERLSKNGFIYRYQIKDDGLKGQEGAFGICNFWLIENLAKQGRIDDAVMLFEKMLECSGETGLFSEELDPESFEMLGNYPQGFTHIGLINAAFSINEAIKERNVT
jgi:pentatricopeptide repeat protein